MDHKAFSGLYNGKRSSILKRIRKMFDGKTVEFTFENEANKYYHDIGKVRGHVDSVYWNKYEDQAYISVTLEDGSQWNLNPYFAEVV